MKTLARLIRRALRRPAPAHRGWQDFELGTYVTEPAPGERTASAVTLHDIFPDLLPWQEALLKHHGWEVRNQMLQADRRPEDARITIHGRQKTTGLTVFGVPVVVDPQVPPDDVLIEFTEPPLRFEQDWRLP